jgi:subtilisin family serine protease
LTALGWNFLEGNSNTTDQGYGSSLPPGGGLTIGSNPGHGMATLALLSGNKAPDGMVYGGHAFDSEIGGAPEAQVVPVRISESVVHLYTKTMAQGIDYALAPANDVANKCDVISISHGGLPSRLWAAAVNMVYEAGIVLVAASGDYKRLGPFDIPFMRLYGLVVLGVQ